MRPSNTHLYLTDEESAPVPVLFRMMRGVYPEASDECLAVFPTLEEPGGKCTCYAHVGQHGQSCLALVIRGSRPAKPREYAALKRELESLPNPYRLRVMKRCPARR